MCTYNVCNVFESHFIFFLRQVSNLSFLLPMGVQNIHYSFIEYNMHVIKHSFVQSILYLNRAEHLISVEAHRH